MIKYDYNKFNCLNQRNNINMIMNNNNNYVIILTLKYSLFFIYKFYLYKTIETLYILKNFI